MWFFVALILAVSLGAMAPHLWPRRPILALTLVVALAPLLLLWRYVTFVAADDWEGMGALALSLAAAAWAIVTGAVGAFSLRRLRED